MFTHLSARCWGSVQPSGPAQINPRTLANQKETSEEGSSFGRNQLLRVALVCVCILIVVSVHLLSLQLCLPKRNRSSSNAGSSKVLTGVEIHRTTEKMLLL